MPKEKTSISLLLHEAQVAIDNSLADPLILGAVAEFGYTEEKLAAARTLHDEAVKAVHEQKLASGTQQTATASLKKAEEEASNAYQDLAKVARAIYVDTPDKLVPLGLDQRMPRTTALFIAAAYKLFQNATLQTELADYG